MKHLFLFIFIANTLFNGALGQSLKKSIKIEAGACDTIERLKQTAGSYVWNTGNQDIAAVNDKGVVCGKNVGKTYITAISKTSDRTYHIDVEVYPVKENQTGAVRSDRADHCTSKDNILSEIISGQKYLSKDSKLKVSENKRYLVNLESNAPFLFLSQTLWGMARRLSREEVVEVLDVCAAQGFTAIQLIAHAHYMGENVYGDLPFENENFECPDITPGDNHQDEEEYDWWDHLEFILQECTKRDLMICLLPTWREQWNQKENLNERNAFAYGNFIGRRYRHLNKWIIWVMGGDAAPDSEAKVNIHRELARGVSFGINEMEKYDNLMMTYHTHGPTITNTFLNEKEAYMDFNTIQSGHSLKNLEGMLEKSYQTQNKPTIDFEPLYDKNGLLLDETRTTIYWGVFSGGFGTSYGSWNTWHCGARNDIAAFKIPDSFHRSFASQIKHLGTLLKGHPMELRIPNPPVLVDNPTKGFERILANSATDSSYIYVYSPNGAPFKVDLNFVKGKRINYQWFNPRNGEIESRGSFKRKGRVKEFFPPTRGESFSGKDWVLILD